MPSPGWGEGEQSLRADPSLVILGREYRAEPVCQQQTQSWIGLHSLWPGKRGARGHTQPQANTGGKCCLPRLTDSTSLPCWTAQSLTDRTTHLGSEWKPVCMCVRAGGSRLWVSVWCVKGYCNTAPSPGRLKPMGIDSLAVLEAGNQGIGSLALALGSKESLFPPSLLVLPVSRQCWSCFNCGRLCLQCLLFPCVRFCVPMPLLLHGH